MAPSATHLVDSILIAIDHHKFPLGVKKIPRVK
jgi:hypothetical protein